MERRRDARYAARWTTRILLSSESVGMLTGDVSFHGLFLHTPIRLNLGQLIRVTVAPYDEERFPIHLVPVRLLPFGDGFAIGARLLAVPDRWEHLVANLRDASNSAIRIRLAPVPEAVAPRLAAKRRAASR